MPKAVFDMTCINVADVESYARERCARNPEYENARPYIVQAFLAACKDGLTYNRRTNTMRDKAIGMLSRPVDDWPEASPDDAALYMAREVWCRAIRLRNLALC
jgi:hypothetical protein